LLRCTVPPCRPSRQRPPRGRLAKPPGEPACQSCGLPTSRTPEEK
jgi:hypothetical protein